MSDQASDPRRDQLLGWIAGTRRTQRRLTIVLVVLFVVSLLLRTWRSEVGTIAIFLTALVGICGFWITSSHIVDWKNRIRELDTYGKKLRVAGGGKRF